MDYPYGFEPVSFGPSPGFRDPDAPPPTKKRRGGPRPGAGAPKGNLNALKHGRHSKQRKQLIAMLVEIPEVRDALIAMANRNRQRRKRAEAQAGRLLVDWVERAGNPLPAQNNQPQNNLELRRRLNAVKAQLEENTKKQPTAKRSRLNSTKPER